MVSMHTSPLATPGVGDAGGLNVYVAELARRLGERGIKVDVFTRRDAPDLPDIVDIHEHTRVIHLTGGPGRQGSAALANRSVLCRARGTP
jgi:D-inositol-3-phosphate glycosyltransferase